MLDQIWKLQREKEEQEEQRKMLESNMSDEDVSKKLNEKLKEQQDKIRLLEEMVSSKWD